MAQLDVMIQDRTRTAIQVVSRFTRVVRAYLFGSQVDGTADRWSDIDVAVFVEGLAAWDLHDRARVAAQVQKEAGDDIEMHFLPAEALADRDPAGFAAWVLAHGVQLPA
jgi:predicted nucleotidyltransferase